MSHLQDTPAGPVLSIQNLSIGTRSGQSLVRDVSFDVHAGETVCIVGESGSGKSLTSLAVMGLLPKGVLHATAGTAVLNGVDMLQASPAQLLRKRATEVAMVFQEPMTALNPVQRVGDQIDEVLRLHTDLPRAQRKARVLAMLERVGMPDIQRIHASYPHQLSGGQRQRIVIAMALILRPRLLIADEPTTALDVTTQKQVLQLMKELQQEQGTAVIFITHDFGVVSEIADRIVVMNRGDVVETGGREEVLSRPVAAYTRLLISSVPSLVARFREDAAVPPVLEVIGLDKVYAERRFLGKERTTHAARDVTFAVRPGQITGIIGESGSGKTTVARCVMRLVEPTAGSIFLGGDAVQGRRSAETTRAFVQYIFQDPYRSLNPRRTVGDSVSEGLVNGGMARDEAMTRARGALERVGIPADALSRYPHQFSGGQRQRICIARAVVMEPRVLVADEAVSALDVSVQAQVLALLERLRDELNIGILFITHDLRVAAQICNSVIVMKRGEVVEAGDAADVLMKPKHAYTRALIAAAPATDWDFRNFRPLDDGPPDAPFDARSRVDSLPVANGS